MKAWKLWLALSLLLLLAIFVLQNTRVVEVRLLFWKVEMSRALMLIVVLAAGLASGWLLGARTGRSR